MVRIRQVNRKNSATANLQPGVRTKVTRLRYLHFPASSPTLGLMPVRSQMRFLQMYGPSLASGFVDDAAQVVARKVRRRPIPTGVQLTTFDPLDPTMAADPYPHYKELLAGSRVQYNRTRGIFILSRYEDVRAGARAADVLSSADGISYSRMRSDSLLTVDPPRHTAMRKQAQPAFTRGALESWKAMVEQLAVEHTADLFKSPTVDVVKTLAEPLPTAVIAHILGIAGDDLVAFKNWSNETVRLANANFSLSGARQGIAGMRAIGHFHAYFTGKLGRGELLDEHTVLGRLVANSHSGKLTPDELFFFAFLLLLAGNETTTNMLGTLFLTLSANPDQFQLLKDNPDLVPSAIEEQLRYYAPIQGLYRTARTDYPVGDAVIPAGARVLLLWGAANRDPRQFEDPDEFRVERNPTGHVSFGSGVHLCLGAQLARLEGHSVLREIVKNVDRIDILGAPGWRTNPTLRGLEKLKVHLTRREDVAGPVDLADAHL
ncbi:MAG: cytochrome P450 [Actinomycetota bacterium]